MKRGLLADEIAMGRDENDAVFKANMAAYDMGINQMNAYAMRFNNPVIDAAVMAETADIQERKMQLGQAYLQQAEAAQWERKKDIDNLALQKRQVTSKQRAVNDQQWRAADKRAQRRSTQKAPRQTNVPLMRETRNAKEEEEARQIRGPSGRVIGRADAPEGAINARKIVDNAARGKALYMRGRELFKGGRSRNPASDLYREQKTFDTAWINYTKTADGDFSAPNATDFENRGVFSGVTSMSPLAALEEGHRNARAQGAAALKMYVPEDELVREDIIDAPQKSTAAGNLQGLEVEKESPAGPSL
jgi:hypothetical protein